MAVSLVVKQVAENWKNPDDLHIRSVVVPAAISSRYDLNDEYESTISDIARYVQGAASSRIYIQPQFASKIDNVPAMAQTVSDLLSLIGSDITNDVAIIFNRQSQNGRHR